MRLMSAILLHITSMLLAGMKINHCNVCVFVSDTTILHRVQRLWMKWRSVCLPIPFTWPQLWMFIVFCDVKSWHDLFLWQMEMEMKLMELNWQKSRYMKTVSADECTRSEVRVGTLQTDPFASPKMWNAMSNALWCLYCKLTRGCCSFH